MNVDDCLRAADASSALELTQAQVRENPSDARLRTTLFQLLLVQGEWSRAALQLDLLPQLPPDARTLSEIYHPMLRAEKTRQVVLAAERTPPFMGETRPWMDLRKQGLAEMARGDLESDGGHLEQVAEAASALSGQIDGVAFASIADADFRFGPCLEAVINGEYALVPFQDIASFRLKPPSTLLSLVWQPVRFVWRRGGGATGFLFARYPGTETSADGTLKLSRRTEWPANAADSATGLGQRMLASDQADFPLLDVRHVEMAAA